MKSALKSILDKIKRFAEEALIKEESILSFAINVEKIELDGILNSIQLKDEKFFYSERPEENSSFLGMGSVFSVNVSGNNRVSETAASIEQIEKSFKSNWKDFGLTSVPLFLGGMKFSANDPDELWSDYSDSDWFIPKYLFYKFDNSFYLIYNFSGRDYLNNKIEEELSRAFNLINNIELNDIEEYNSIISSNVDDYSEKLNWIDNVKVALKKIESGEVQKIVLSRQVELELQEQSRISYLLSQLRVNYPRCYIFAFGKGESIFFGASPEKLAKIANGWIEADALAGSTPRGSDTETDIKLATDLLSSEKNLAEQQVVVNFIEHSFAEFCEEIIYDEKPIIRKLPNIQHLWTPIKAKLKSQKKIFSILKEIHPTPAICGVPWTSALDSIRELENHNRGLFAGMVGWFNFYNEGEFAVAIRSALMKKKKVYAFAGCGIVDGSDPELEFEESELKLKPILSLFENEKVYQS